MDCFSSALHINNKLQLRDTHRSHLDINHDVQKTSTIHRNSWKMLWRTFARGTKRSFGYFMPDVFHHSATTQYKCFLLLINVVKKWRKAREDVSAAERVSAAAKSSIKVRLNQPKAREQEFNDTLYFYRYNWKNSSL